jgi:hypothetical protein
MGTAARYPGDLKPRRRHRGARSASPQPEVTPRPLDAVDAAPPGGAYFIVNGRRWRRSDPAIPESLRQEIVNELMAARRAVGAAGHVKDEKAARARVNDAKLALGERGRAWWLQPTTVDRNRRIDATIRTLLRSRREDASICPSDVARAVGGTSWPALMVDVRNRAAALAKSGEISIWRRRQIVTEEPTSGVLRYRLIR